MSLSERFASNLFVFLKHFKILLLLQIANLGVFSNLVVSRLASSVWTRFRCIKSESRFVATRICSNIAVSLELRLLWMETTKAQLKGTKRLVTVSAFK